MSLDALSRAWLVLGFLGQGMFTARFLVQWIASERKGTSVVPRVFWWFSLAGGALLLLYAINRRDPVFIVGQLAGLVVYSRNLMLIRASRASATSPSAGGPGGRSSPSA